MTRHLSLVDEVAAELARSLRGLEQAASGTYELRAEKAEWRTLASYRSGDRARHPDGGQHPVAEVERDEAPARGQIESDTVRGSGKHQRPPRWIARIPVVLPLVDFCLLLYLFSALTNANWAIPLGANLMFAVLLAAMVTVLSYGFLALAGYRLRSNESPAEQFSTRHICHSGPGRLARGGLAERAFRRSVRPAGQATNQVIGGALSPRFTCVAGI